MIPRPLTLGFVLAIGIAPSVACSAAPPPDESDHVVRTSQDLAAGGPGAGGGAARGGGANTGGGGKAPPPPPAPAFPPQGAQYCSAVEPSCSIAPQQGAGDLDRTLRDLGCAPAQHWFSGESSGLLGGILTVCYDTPAVRAYFSSMQLSALAGKCNACLPRLPRSEVYVLIEAFVGPNCQSGCGEQ